MFYKVLGIGLLIVLVLIVLGSIYLYRRMVIHVYRLYRDTCPACVSSQAEWDEFKNTAKYSPILIHDIDITNKDDLEEYKDVLEHVEYTTVPHVVMLVKDNEYVAYDRPERTSKSYFEWISEQKKSKS